MVFVFGSAPTCDKHRRTDKAGQRVESRQVCILPIFSRIKLAEPIYCFHFPKEQHWTDERQLPFYPPLAVVLCFAVFG